MNGLLQRKESFDALHARDGLDFEGRFVEVRRIAADDLGENAKRACGKMGVGDFGNVLELLYDLGNERGFLCKNTEKTRYIVIYFAIIDI